MGEFIRPYESHVVAFNRGYDMGKEIAEGKNIKVADVQHMVKRLHETQLILGPNKALMELAKQLESCEQDLDQAEQQGLHIEEEVTS